jgi:predicted PhzF superfamily epimerase YddE/YHI9
MRIRVIDAFAQRPFTGNPAAVVLLPGDDWPPVDWMQSVAAEMNLSETAFAHELTQENADWALRWFTPMTEVDLCGHATLATAHAIGPASAIRFATRSGILVATPRPDGSITVDLPVNHPVPTPIDPGLAPALGAVPVATYTTGALRDLLVELDSEETVRGLTPDFLALGRLDARGVIVTAKASSANGTYDFVSRFFGPAVGITEDPVTGSAHTALAPLWSARLGRDSLTGLQVSARAGLVHTSLLGERVELTGYAITVLDGQLCG